MPSKPLSENIHVGASVRWARRPADSWVVLEIFPSRLHVLLGNVHGHNIICNDPENLELIERNDHAE